MKPKHKICEVCDPFGKHHKRFKMKRMYIRENKPINKYHYKRSFSPIGWFCQNCGSAEVNLEVIARIKIEQEERKKREIEWNLKWKEIMEKSISEP